MAVPNPIMLQPQSIGERYIAGNLIQGPSSYTTGGVALSPNKFALLFFQFVWAGACTPDGLYFADFYSNTIGNEMGTTVPLYMRWKYATSAQGVIGADVVLGSSPTNGTYNITATSGSGEIQVVVAGGAITKVTVLNPGVYAAPPTFTPPAGLGSGATITAYIGSSYGLEVAPGTNLSSEYIRVLAIGQ